jgi:hypothetical protein
MAKYGRDIGKMTFEQGLSKWVKTTEQSKALLHGLACVALTLFVEHGDLSKLQILLDTLKSVGKNYVRVAAFEKWMAAHAPITMVEKKLVKKDGAFDAALIEKALDTPFWEFAPDQEVSPFLANDIIARLNGMIKQFKGKSYTPKDAEAQRMLTKVEEFASTLTVKETVTVED